MIGRKPETDADYAELSLDIAEAIRIQQLGCGLNCCAHPYRMMSARKARAVGVLVDALECDFSAARFSIGGRYPELFSEYFDQLDAIAELLGAK